MLLGVRRVCRGQPTPPVADEGLCGAETGACIVKETRPVVYLCRHREGSAKGSDAGVVRGGPGRVVGVAPRIPMEWVVYGQPGPVSC